MILAVRVGRGDREWVSVGLGSWDWGGSDLQRSDAELAWRKFGAQHFIIVFGCLISDYVRDLSNNLGGVDFKKFRF